MRTIASADGTLIAYEQGGQGPHLVLVHGYPASRERWASIRPKFEQHFTVTAMDRRGRGDSGDSPTYSIERESEDVSAIIKALNGPVLLLGHSFGGLCALEGAMQAENVAGLILYEPSIYGEGESGVPPELLDRLDALLASGEREGVVTTVMAEIAELSRHEIEVSKASPAWLGRVAAAHTLPREIRAEETYRLSADRVDELSIPVLLLLGSDSPPFYGRAIARLQEILPNSRTLELPGQQHIAMDTGPDLLVSVVLAFWRDIN